MKRYISDNYNRFIFIICLFCFWQIIVFTGCSENNNPLNPPGAGGEAVVVIKPYFSESDENIIFEDITEISLESKIDDNISENISDNISPGNCKKESGKWKCVFDIPNTASYMTFTLKAMNESKTVVCIGEVNVVISLSSQSSQINITVNMIPVIPSVPPADIKPYVGSVVVTSKSVAGKAVPLKLSLHGGSNAGFALSFNSEKNAVFDSGEAGDVNKFFDDSGEAYVTVMYTPIYITVLSGGDNSYTDVVTVSVEDSSNNLSSELIFTITVINSVDSDPDINFSPEIISFSSEKVIGNNVIENMVTFIVVAIDDNDPQESLVYEWRKEGEILGASESSVTVSEPSYGEEIKVTVVDTEGAVRSYSIKWGHVPK